MSYTVTLAKNTIPTDDKKAWKYIEQLQEQETDEQSKDFLDLIEKLKEKFPCICDLPDEDIDKSRFLSLNQGKGLQVESFKSTFYGYIECYNAEREIRIRDISSYV
jgi:hypothetical protein